MIPQDLRYTNDHEWVRIEGDEAVVGITDYAQAELGDITFVELPDKGKQISKGAGAATVESVKAASDIYSPVSGDIIEVNNGLENSPEMINQSPYETGWVFRVKVLDSEELNGLMDAASYEKYLDTLR